MVLFGALAIVLGLVSWYSSEAIASFWTTNPRLFRVLVLVNRASAVAIVGFGVMVALFGALDGRWAS